MCAWFQSTLQWLTWAQVAPLFVIAFAIALLAFCPPVRRFLFRDDLNHNPNIAYDTENGYGPFTALASFALAQGAALTAVAKGEDRTWLVLFIYAVTVTVTILWLRTLLGATKPTTVAGKTLRAYDEPTFAYGWWAQLWTCLQALVLIYLGTQGLLPNQTTRVPYTGEDCLLFFRNETEITQIYYNGNNNWHKDLLKPYYNNKPLLWFEQKSPLKANYTPFTMTLEFSNRVSDQQKFQVFLARRNASSFQFREVTFTENANQFRFQVPEANQGDFFVVIGYADYEPNKAGFVENADAKLQAR